MPSSRIPSPARSQGVISTPRKDKLRRRTRSVCSPAQSNVSVRLSTLVSYSYKISPMPNRQSVLTDETDIEIVPGRQSWWKKLGDNSRDVMDVLETKDMAEIENVADEFDVEVLSQEKQNYTLDLPESSDGESISSIVIPQRKLFTQKEHNPQKKFAQIINNRDSQSKHKSHIDHDKDIEVAPKNLFSQPSKPRNKPVFPAALLNISANKTMNKTKEMPVAEVKGQVRSLFGNRPGTKRKNMFADFIVSDSEDDIPDIQPKVFGFQKNVEKKRRESSSSQALHHSPTSSIDLELDDWKLLPSSTMVGNQLEDTTPVKRARLCKLSEVKETETLSTINKTLNKTKQSNKSNIAKNKPNKSSNSKLDVESSKLQDDKINVIVQSNDQGINNSNSRLTRNKSKSIRETSLIEANRSKTKNKSKNITSKDQSIINKVNDNQENINLLQDEGNIQNELLLDKAEDDEDFTLEYENDDEQNNECLDNNANDWRQSKDKNDTMKQTSIKKTLDEEKQSVHKVTNKSSYNKQENTNKSRQNNVNMDNDMLDGNATEKPVQLNNKQEIQNNNNEKLIESENVKNKTNVSIHNTSKKHNKSKNKQDEIVVAGNEVNQENHNNTRLNKNSQSESNSVSPEMEHKDDKHDKSKHISEENEEENENNEQNNTEENEEENKSSEQGNAKDNEENESNEQNNTEGNEEENVSSEQNNAEENEEIASEIEDQNESQEIQNKSQEDETKQIDSEEEQNECDMGNETEEMEENQELNQNDDEEDDSDNVKQDDEGVTSNHEEEENESTVNKTDEQQNESVEIDENEEEDEDNEEQDMENEDQDVENDEQEMENEVQGMENEDHDVENDEQEMENEEQGMENEDQDVENDEQEMENEEQDMENNEKDVEQEIENDEQGMENEDQDVENDEQQMENEEQDIENDDQDVENDEQEMENEDQDVDNEEEEEDVEQEVENDDQESNESEVEGNEYESEQVDHDDPSEEENDDEDEEVTGNINDESPNITHDTTGRHRNIQKVTSPEAILHDKTNQIDSFMAVGRNTSVRKTKSILAKTLNIRPSLAPVRESTGFSDGTRNSSADNSGWDSHRTTRKTIRETFGKEFTTRKSLRALVMEKSAKRHTNFMEKQVDLTENVDNTKIPQANSTEFPHFDSYEDPEPVHVDETTEESDRDQHDMSKRTRQTTLEMYLQKIKQDNLERKRKIEEQVRNSLKTTTQTYNPFKVPQKPVRRVKPAESKPRPKQTRPLVFMDMLPAEVIEDMKYKPPKRFNPNNASWITKRLYKFLETKLEPKYDYKARVRAEKLVETIYNFTKDVRKQHVAPLQMVDALKHEMARLNIVKTHFDFYEFFQEYMPREIRIKVIPDVVNNISLPKHGVFADIIR